MEISKLLAALAFGALIGFSEIFYKKEEYVIAFFFFCSAPLLFVFLRKLMKKN